MAVKIAIILVAKCYDMHSPVQGFVTYETLDKAKQKKVKFTHVRL